MRRRDFIKVISGAAVSWPLAARAQRPDRTRRIGFLTASYERDIGDRLAVFLTGLQELGWTIGRNIRIDYRFSDGDATSTAKLAKELIELQPDVIFAHGTAGTTALRQYTLSIPIVFVQVPDPVAAGFVTNLARPNGNVTGFVNFEFAIGEKWLQLLKEYVPSAARIAVIFDPANPSWTAYMRAIEAAAPSMGVQLTPAGVRDDAEIENSMNAFARTPNRAIVVLPNPITTAFRERIIAVAARHRLPAIYPYRYFAASGGLMSYGVNLSDQFRRAASYVDRILKGEKPANLPVELPTKFNLVINIKTANTESH
jgi:putative tryptophan/tyrosine transport system substrate-binding protein